MRADKKHETFHVGSLEGFQQSGCRIGMRPIIEREQDAPVTGLESEDPMREESFSQHDLN
jgi:hypothetical protein